MMVKNRKWNLEALDGKGELGDLDRINLVRVLQSREKMTVEYQLNGLHDF